MDGRSRRKLQPRIIQRPPLEWYVNVPILVSCLRTLSQSLTSLCTGSATLPSPAGKTLVAITLGRGIQNYTCNTTTNTFVSIGAVATLFDTTPLLSTISPAQGQNVLNMLPGYAVTFPLSTIQTNASFAVLGNHFFDASGVPIFDLGSVGVLDGAKAGDIAAPKCAPKGGDGHGAVDWLALTAKPGAASVTLTEGYRVVTAGGKPPSGGCTAPAETQVQYAALYWFFK